MINCVTEDNGDGMVLRLSGDLLIQHAVEVSNLIVDALSARQSVEIDVSSATEVDISFLQLLCAAHKTALELNKAVRLGRERSNAFIKVTEEACFLRSQGCMLDPGKECLWRKE